MAKLICNVRSFLWLFSFGFLDDTDSDSLFHVSDSESSEWWVIRENFTAHWFRWDQSNHSGIIGFNEFWFFFKFFTRSSIDFAVEFVEFTSDVSSVAI